jgi:hypothetical protein
MMMMVVVVKKQQHVVCCSSLPLQKKKVWEQGHTSFLRLLGFIMRRQIVNAIRMHN